MLFSLLTRTSIVIVLFNVPKYWIFHCVVGFIICGHNIQFNNMEMAKRVNVLQIKHNEVLRYIIQHAQSLDSFTDTEKPRFIYKACVRYD